MRNSDEVQTKMVLRAVLSFNICFKFKLKRDLKGFFENILGLSFLHIVLQVIEELNAV